MTATPIEADPYAWRALDEDTRQAIRTAAKSGQPASAEHEAIAVVAWSRWWRSRYPYQMIIFLGTVLVAVCAAFAERVGPGPERLGLGVLGCVLGLAAFRLMIKRSQVARTASVNYAAATERAPLALPAAITLTRPRLWFVTNALATGSYVFWVACTIYALQAQTGTLHRHPTVVTIIAGLWAIVTTRDGLQTPQTATVGPDGISVPWWQATVAWSAVRLVEVRYTGGEWTITWYVDRGSVRTGLTGKRRIARFADMAKVAIISEEPDVALWLTRRYVREAADRSRECRRLASALRRRQTDLGSPTG